MIAELTSKTQYGKKGTVGINLLSELDGEPVTSYAHSVQDALDWATAFPLYQDAIVDKFENGCILIASPWNPRNKSDLEVAGVVDLGLEMAEYERSQIVIRPVNTIYENTGFQKYGGDK